MNRPEYGSSIGKFGIDLVNEDEIAEGWLGVHGVQAGYPTRECPRWIFDSREEAEQYADNHLREIRGSIEVCGPYLY